MFQLRPSGIELFPQRLIARTVAVNCHDGLHELPCPLARSWLGLETAQWSLKTLRRHPMRVGKQRSSHAAGERADFEVQPTRVEALGREADETGAAVSK